MALPPQLTLPSDEWTTGYKKFVSTLHQPRPELLSVNTALTLAGTLLNPLLSPDNPFTAGLWSPETQQWSPTPQPAGPQ